MRVVFECVDRLRHLIDDDQHEHMGRARRLYTVLDDNDEPIFTGMTGECARFLEIHAEKVLKSRLRETHHDPWAWADKVRTGTMLR